MKAMLLCTYTCCIHKEPSNIMQMVCEAHSVKECNGVICFLRHRLQCGGCLRGRHIMFPDSWHPGNIIISGGWELQIFFLCFFWSYLGSLVGAVAFPSVQWVEGRNTFDIDCQSITGFNSPASCLAKETQKIHLKAGSYGCVWFVVKLSFNSLGIALL